MNKINTNLACFAVGSFEGLRYVDHRCVRIHRYAFDLDRHNWWPLDRIKPQYLATHIDQFKSDNVDFETLN